MRRSDLATSRRGMMLGRVGMKGGRGGEKGEGERRTGQLKATVVVPETCNV